MMRNSVKRSAIGLPLLGLLMACAGAEQEGDTAASGWAALMDDDAASNSTLAEAAASTAGASTSRNCSDCSTTPLAWWKFDHCNAQSTELDDYASSTSIQHPAFRAVSVGCVDGRESQAVQLARRDDLIYSPDQPDYDFSQGLTVAAWVKPDSVARTQSLVRKRLYGTSSFALAIENGRIEFVVRLTSRKLVGITAPIQSSRFTHVTATYDGQQLRLYLDGALAADRQAVGTIAAGVGPIYIGNDASGRQFKGVVDEVWLNTLAASPDTVKRLNCVRVPPVVSITPNTTPATLPNVPVTFDISITNPTDPQFCAVGTYELNPTLQRPLELTTPNWYTEVLIPPGQTAHHTVDIVAADAGYSGPATVSYAVYDADNYSMSSTARATFVVAARPLPTATGCTTQSPPPVAPGGYYVNGNTICTFDGRPHHLHGVDRPSLEWSPSGTNLLPADFQLMGTWKANVVRIALNQDFWLSNSPQADPYYRATVNDAIAWAEMAGMDVILDLHWSDAGRLGSCTSTPSSTCQQLMADDNSIVFWSEVAHRYKNDGRVMFELYNEPHDISWDIWRNGGTVSGGWHAAGMQQLYNTVRATGASNLVLIGGLDWAYDLSGVPNNRIDGYNIAYVTHPYGPYRDPSDWGRAWGSLTYTDPVVATEFGMLNDTNCTADYAARVIQYADAHLANWTAWAWYPGGCTFPALITDWSGTPSAVGAIVKSTLLGFDDPPASPPLPYPGGPDINYTFDRQPQGWALNTYADPNLTNLGAPGASPEPPTLTFDSTNGSPAPGSLLLTVSFTAFDQYVDPQVTLDQAGINATGKTLHALVRLVSGTLTGGGMQMHASTGPNWAWGSTSWVSGDALASGDWVPVSVDLDAVTSSGFDPSKLLAVGIQFISGSSSEGGTFTNTGPIVVEIDTVTD